MEWIFAGAAALMLAAAVWGYVRNRRMYRTIDRMLDEVLNGEKITQSDIREGEISALAAKALRVQELLGEKVRQADEEREEVKGLISNMSHQLKTPLAAVMMYQELLQGGLSGEDRRRFLEKMRVQTEKLSWILNSLFKMVRLEQNAIDFTPGNAPILPTIRAAAGDVYEKAQKKQIEIILEPFEDVPLYHSPKWTEEALKNLLENAVKYSPAKSRISISLRRFEMYSEIRVKDEGMGIRREEQTKIFRRFYRSPEAELEEGSGIGLYLAKLIAEKEKGYVNVASEHGKGSVFSVFLQNCKNFTGEL